MLRNIVAVLVLVTLVAGAVVWWSSSPGVTSRRELDQARARWAEREPTKYSFVISSCSGMCIACPWRITVLDGEPVAVERAGGDRGCGAPPTVEQASTIDTLLDTADQERARLFGHTWVAYDAHWGIPVRFEDTCTDADCGSGTSIYDFRVLAE
ncbi:DUF6174 domain-containing protein [Nocardioides exalbidus]|uniref:DUF6174 domain-containing protein n=1 Tax=Nocardioides exalbidus TaxID=402596 RepID=UPI000B882398|nr:DUF6174 domain-containing protein [Nocardioides exalbidus]